MGGRKSRVPTVGTLRGAGDRTVGGRGKGTDKTEAGPGLERHQAYSQDRMT